jgi:site-specific DNA-cytosine methylase
MSPRGLDLSPLGTARTLWQVLGIPVNCIFMCDRKKSSRQYLNIVHPSSHTCLYEDMSDIAAGRGLCHRHHRICQPRMPVDGVDSAIMGTPCQPFSGMRDCNGTPPHQHADWTVTFDLFFDYLRARRPKGGIAEQVLGFAKGYYMKPGDLSMTVPLHMFAGRLRGEGYSVQTFKLDAADWTEVPRERRSAHAHSWSEFPQTIILHIEVRLWNLSGHDNVQTMFFYFRAFRNVLFRV